VAIADASGNTGVYLADDANGDTNLTAGEMTLVAVMQGTAIGSLTYNNFSNAATP